MNIGEGGGELVGREVGDEGHGVRGDGSVNNPHRSEWNGTDGRYLSK